MEINSKSFRVVGNSIEVSKKNIDCLIYDYYYSGGQYSDGIYMIANKK